MNASPIRVVVPRLFSTRIGSRNGRETVWRKRCLPRLEKLSFQPVDRRYYQPLDYEYFIAPFELADHDRRPEQAPPAQPTLKLDPRTYDRALSCVHCGLCLPACPTYLQTGHEAEGPRGRIQLMRGLSDGQIDPTKKVREHLDSCLNCRACETACPSGVVYHEMTRRDPRPAGQARPRTAAGIRIASRGFALVRAKCVDASESSQAFDRADSAVAAERGLSPVAAIPGDGNAAGVAAENGTDVAGGGPDLAEAAAAIYRGQGNGRGIRRAAERGDPWEKWEFDGLAPRSRKGKRERRRVLRRLRGERFLRPRQSDGDRNHGGLRRGCVYPAATGLLRRDAQTWRRPGAGAGTGAGEYRSVSSPRWDGHGLYRHEHRRLRFDADGI